MTRTALFRHVLPPLLAAGLALGAPVRAQDGTAAGQADPVADTQENGQAGTPQPRAPYRVVIEGVEDDGLRDTLTQASALVGLVEDPPPTLAGLERRADSDRERLQTVLRSTGRYDGRIDTRVEVGRDGQPASVTVTVTPGPLYHVKTVTRALLVNGAALTGPAADSLLGEPKLKAGDPAEGQRVVDAETALLDRLRARGYAFARMGDRRVLVDHTDRSMDVAWRVALGPLVRTGAVRVSGLERVDEGVVRRRLDLPAGAVHDPAALDRARQDLAKLEVFDTVRVRLDEQPGPDGVTPVVVAVTERKPRVIGGGVSYSTAEGVGAQAYWGHRNLFGGAEKLRVGLEVGRVAGSSGGTSSRSSSVVKNLPDLRFNLSFRKPDFLAVHQTLQIEALVASEQPPAYSRIATQVSATLDRPLTERLSLSYGLTAERGRVETAARTYQTFYAGAPFALAWNRTNDPLNPTEGERGTLRLTPWIPMTGAERRPFLALQATGSVYYDLAQDGRYVAAARVGLGSLLGGLLDRVSPDHRFYAGGGGSVRGYGFQKAGPRSAAGEPTGGRSLAELGVELRIKVTDSIGLVPFLDAGAVSDRLYPAFTSGLRVGAGLGARYYTDFGPLRLDLGVPLNAPKGDARWQLYLSLGQAF
ncbi:autotransporter assembly complex protein TamA [Azospirillum griseum]|uniref:Outer membrane protein assembly factor n=1 Tax=Azospirillum griseum TaxID=2496639 RepID=A0A431VJ90_9PROT|nr:BamA/TamA family outer membrane protein [Azospirillum griseum]RTR20644.1 outer membrane protein assembly factor [Azospirillum griseum]